MAPVTINHQGSKIHINDVRLAKEFLTIFISLNAMRLSGCHGLDAVQENFSSGCHGLDASASVPYTAADAKSIGKHNADSNEDFSGRCDGLDTRASDVEYLDAESKENFSLGGVLQDTSASDSDAAKPCTVDESKSQIEAIMCLVQDINREVLGADAKIAQCETTINGMASGLTEQHSASQVTDAGELSKQSSGIVLHRLLGRVGKAVCGIIADERSKWESKPRSHNQKMCTICLMCDRPFIPWREEGTFFECERETATSICLQCVQEEERDYIERNCEGGS